MLVFAEERGKPEYPEKHLSEQSREQTTNSTHIWRWVRKSNPGHIGEASALTTAPSLLLRREAFLTRTLATAGYRFAPVSQRSWVESLWDLNFFQALISQLLCAYNCDDQSYLHIFLWSSNAGSFIYSFVMLNESLLAFFTLPFHLIFPGSACHLSLTWCSAL